MSQSACQDNNNPCRGDDDTWWYSTSDIVPSEAKIYGQLTLRDSMYMEFDIVNTGGISSQWENIFRIGFTATISGTRCDGAASRYPGLYLGPDDDVFQFLVSDTDNCYGGGQWQDPQAFGVYHMLKGIKYSAIIHYNESRVHVQIKNVTSDGPWETYIDTDRSGTHPYLFNSIVSIFIGTDLYAIHPVVPIANVTLSNIVIVSYWYNNSFTLPPAISPTINPSTEPTNEPTFIPSAVPTLEPTINLTTDPSASPITK